MRHSVLGHSSAILAWNSTSTVTVSGTFCDSTMPVAVNSWLA